MRLNALALSSLVALITKFPLLAFCAYLPTTQIKSKMRHESYQTVASIVYQARSDSYTTGVYNQAPAYFKGFMISEAQDKLL